MSVTRSNFSNNPNGVIYSEFDTGRGGRITVQNSTFTTSGIAIESGRALTVTGSKFSNNVTGLLLTDTDDYEDFDLSGTVSGNVFLGNSSSGLRSTTTLLDIGKNKAANNGRYGLFAPGAYDAGGNIEYGNRLGNCIGITCSPHRSTPRTCE